MWYPVLCGDIASDPPVLQYVVAVSFCCLLIVVFLFLVVPLVVVILIIVIIIIVLVLAARKLLLDELAPAIRYNPYLNTYLFACGCRRLSATGGGGFLLGLAGPRISTATDIPSCGSRTITLGPRGGLPRNRAPQTKQFGLQRSNLGLPLTQVYACTPTSFSSSWVVRARTSPTVST